ncbi:MAG: hypothetical protein LUQ65_04145 [Candidatus Helarchaeota archaeon]|nr:hypothetical protein [Candidatus Helarchaeota archaeon]
MSFFNRVELIVKGAVVQRMLNKDPNEILMGFSSVYKSTNVYDIFMAHSYRDATIILGLVKTIEELGFTIYVDWIDDPYLNRSDVTKETANLLKSRMTSCKSLFFVISSTSPGSKWMPWELGYFDGIKGKVAILPIVDIEISTEIYEGQEYLGLYPYITRGNDTNQQFHIWVNESENVYIGLTAWLKGQNPINHS